MGRLLKAIEPDPRSAILMTPNANTLDKELLKVSLGPIAELLDDPQVTDDIMVYGSQHFMLAGVAPDSNEP